MEKEEQTTISIPKFIRELPLSDHDMHYLLMCIAKIMVTVSHDAGKMTTAACMGFSTEDPRFTVFFQKEISPLLELDPQKVYEDLQTLILKENTNE